MTHVNTFGSWVVVASGLWAGCAGRVIATSPDGRAVVRMMNAPLYCRTADISELVVLQW